jgi:hypothetical protein
MGAQHFVGPSDAVLYRIQRGLAGYVSYLAACDMNPAFSEYVLYEPTLRILTAQAFTVASEVPCPGFPPRLGDKKKLDFVASATTGVRFALEMKWARKRKVPKIGDDVLKLQKFCAANPGSEGFLCVFGVKSVLAVLVVPEALRERRDAVYADLRKTRFGCRVFEVVAQ